MKTNKAATKPTAKKQTKSKPKVFEAWGQAFRVYGTKPNAPKLIHAYLKQLFPARQTNWLQWVNRQRCEYNGGRLPNTPKPKTPIAPYEMKKVA